MSDARIEKPAEPGGLPLLRGEVAFRLLVDAVEDYAIFLLGPDGRILTWNRGAERIKGYTANEIIGEHFSRFYVPEEREAERPMALLGLAAEHGRFEDEGWRVRKDGTRFWADVVMTALYDEGGKPYAYAKVTRDLTERRRAEQQRLQLAAEQRARVAAEEALLARDRFLSIASHELKTPLATLQLAIESLNRTRESGRLDDQRLATVLSRVDRATRRLAVLVSELLDVSRLTADDDAVDTAPTELVAIANDVLERFAEREGTPRAQLDAPDEVWIPADAGRIDQVISNLVDNALKYSTAPSPIHVRIRAEVGGVRIVVLDEGIGLDASDDGRIFEAFGRGENAANTPGMGLGLFICQQIVSRHGGWIRAETRPGGVGSIFTVWLPAEGAGEGNVPTSARIEPDG